MSHDVLCPAETLGLNCSCWLIKDVRKSERNRLLEIAKRDWRPEVKYDSHYTCSAAGCENPARWDWVVEYLCDAHDSVLNLQLKLQQAGELIGEEIDALAERVGNTWEKDDDDFFDALYQAKELAVEWGKNAGTRY